MTDTLLLGAHMSIAGGLDKAIGRGLGVGCTALQIFTKNASQWKAKPLAEEDIARFKTALGESPIGTEAVVAHDSYLINLGSHPGAHMGSGEDAAMRKVAEGLERAVAGSDRAMVLLETTAGQGTTLGN